MTEALRARCDGDLQIMAALLDPIEIAHCFKHKGMPAAPPGARDFGFFLSLTRDTAEYSLKTLAKKVSNVFAKAHALFAWKKPPSKTLEGSMGKGFVNQS